MVKVHFRLCRAFFLLEPTLVKDSHENLNFPMKKSWKSHEIYFPGLRGNPRPAKVIIA